VGTVVSLRRRSNGARLRVQSSFDDARIGDSVAVNGICQTVVETDGRSFSCDVLPETLRVSNLGSLRAGQPVNLERALRAGDRLGGHIVNGHIDGLGTVTRIVRKPLSLEITVPADLGPYLVPKGSVAVDGVSLTVGPAASENRCTVYIIPHTWRHTNLHRLRTGAKVNIEVDILGKYVLNFLRSAPGRMTHER
jgi:riboflavin synthase